MSEKQDIPVVILCGGMGTRLSEQTEARPKPMVEIGGRPILWHIMKHYGRYGFNEFSLALGYKGEQIKRYFLDFYALGQDFTVSLADGQVRTLNHAQAEPWRVHLLDTGQQTLTGGRLKQLAGLVGGSTFMMTYGDGVGNVDLDKLLAFPPGARRAGHADCGPAAGPFRRAGVRGGPDPPLQGEVHPPRKLDQRRLLCHRAGRVGIYSVRRDVGTCADGAPGRRGATVRLSA